ncbi:hypothetical protein [Propionivibrio sp.]|uniref:hypothetical protein n=1 Tax=Propionivibrio sp. TaxID=2212460 RepID=UPI0025E98E84|nr:hypothetical protein [Propionivibrio sp.]
MGRWRAYRTAISSRRRWPKPDAASSSIDGKREAESRAPLAYHWARMIEMLRRAETIKDFLNGDDISAVRT